MLIEYVNAALKKARYETLEDGKIYGEIPDLQGVWAEGATIEECRSELVEVIEGWLFLKLRDRDTIPLIDGLDLNKVTPADAA